MLLNSETNRPAGGEVMNCVDGTATSGTADRVTRIVVEHLAVDADKVTQDAHFIYDLRGDSLDVVELVMAFEEEFGVQIPDDDAEKIATIRDAITYLDEHVC
jgi:acyl carrier protein